MSGHLNRALRKASIITLMIVVAAIILGMAMTGTAWAEDYDLYLICGAPYWASYQDYLDRLLSVDYVVGNNGPGVAAGLEVSIATATNGVTVATPLPLPLGTLGAGDSTNFTLQWLVPAEVSSFTTHIEICATCRVDRCTYDNIDIKPGSCPNSINRDNKGNVAVAILSSPTFDATTIDPDSVMFAGAGPVRWATEDSDGDLLPDVTVHFKTQDLSLSDNQTEACLTAKTYDGEAFEACDSVRIVK